LSFEFSPETLKEEISREIKKLQDSITKQEKEIESKKTQFQTVPEYSIHWNYGKVGDNRHKQITNQPQINRVNQFNASITNSIKSIQDSINSSKKKITKLEEQSQLFSREIDVRNRKTQESQNTLNKSTLNNLKNISNESIGQSMQNEDLRNKLIIGGLVGVLAIAVMKKR